MFSENIEMPACLSRMGKYDLPRQTTPTWEFSLPYAFWMNEYDSIVHVSNYITFTF